jgi:mannosylglycoprotein endo-beta-mannosidase
MSAKKRRKYIASLKKQDGSLVWNHCEKQQVLHDYFQSLMGKKVNRSRTFNWGNLQLWALQQLPGLELDRPFTHSEIEQAIKELPNEKASSPNVFTNDFYKHCWHIIKDDVLSAFEAVHAHHCGALEQINGARVVLILKVEVATKPKDFRLISLIHSFAKLLTKVLALRLSAYIDRLISSAQSAFIKKRCIQDNFLYVRGLARHYHRTKTSACLIKLDITKAFDSVSWEFLLELLSRRGFLARWTDWLSSILSSSSSIMLNGCPGGR